MGGKRTFVIALLFAMIYLAPMAFAGPESRSAAMPGDPTVVLKIAQTVWDTIGLIWFQKALCFLLVLALLPKLDEALLSGSPLLPAGFIRRSAAAVVDAFIFQLPVAIVCFAIFFVTALQIEPVIVWTIQLGVNFLLLLLPAVGAALFESSKLQATPGKLLFGIRVCLIDGRRCGFLRALARRLAFCLSELSFGVGYLACIWTERQQCWQDLAAKCVVVRK